MPVTAQGRAQQQEVVKGGCLLRPALQPKSLHAWQCLWVRADSGSPALEVMDSGAWRRQDSSERRSNGRQTQVFLWRSQVGFPPWAEGMVARGDGSMMLWYRDQNSFRSSLPQLPVSVSSAASLDGFGATQYESNQCRHPGWEQPPPVRKKVRHRGTRAASQHSCVSSHHRNMLSSRGNILILLQRVLVCGAITSVFPPQSAGPQAEAPPGDSQGTCRARSEWHELALSSPTCQGSPVCPAEEPR